MGMDCELAVSVFRLGMLVEPMGRTKAFRSFGMNKTRDWCIQTQARVITRAQHEIYLIAYIFVRFIFGQFMSSYLS